MLSEGSRIRPLHEILLEQDLVTREQLRECVQILQRNPGQSLGHILVEKKFLSEDDLVAALSDQLNIPHMRVANLNIDKEAIEQVPEKMARQFMMIPISVNNDGQVATLTLAMASPQDIMATDELARRFEIRRVVASETQILAAINRNYGGDKAQDAFDLLDRKEEANSIEEEVHRESPDDIEDVSAIEGGADEEPVKIWARLIIFNGLEIDASDIHFEPFEKEIRLRYRVDGVLQQAKSPPKHLQQNLIARYKILSNCRIDESRLPQDGRFRIKYKNREVDFRVAYLPCKYGQKIVMRVLDKSNLSLDLDAMGFERQPREAFEKALGLPNGMILVTGPTGSGKTTTLYSALHKLNTIDINIVTVEDPIEYELFGINQVQVHSNIGLTFAEALRQILRQDPDVVMVGEIRDHETADVAVKAALTGHLVLSTLHTNDAAGVFPRLMDMGVEAFLVQSSVVLTSAQRLLRRVCGNCKESVRVSKEVLDRLHYVHTEDDGDGPPNFVKGRGCNKCRETGYKGRVAVLEAMLNYPELGDLIMHRASSYDIKKMAMQCGMRTLRQNGMSKAIRGITDLPQVLDETKED